MKALANEVAKNLVLAGIGSLTILDHDPVTEADLDAQFFLEDVHKGPSIIAEGKKVRQLFTYWLRIFYGILIAYRISASRRCRPSNPPYEPSRETAYRYRRRTDKTARFLCSI